MNATIACLREVDVTTLVGQEWLTSGVVNFTFIPVVDGTFLTERPEETIASKKSKSCRILLGANRNEGTYFLIYYLTDILNRTEHYSLNAENFNETVNKLSPYDSSVSNAFLTLSLPTEVSHDAMKYS